MENETKKAVSDAQRRATATYLQKFDDLRIRVPKGQKELIAQQAAANGESINAYIVRIVMADMKGVAINE